MSDSTYLKLVSGSRLKNYMGLEMAPGVEYKNGKGYLYIEIPVGAFIGSPSTGAEPGTSEILKEVKRNQHVFVSPSCTVNVKGGYIVEIEPSTEFAKFGQVQPGYKIHPDSGLLTPGFYFTARKDVTLSDFTWAVRLYMYS